MYFQKKEFTQEYEGRQTEEQNDHVLVEKDEENSITDISAFRGTGIDIDQLLIGVFVKQILPIK